MSGSLCEASAPTRILAVDDDAATTRWVKIVLEETGRYEVREVNDPRAAEAAAREFQPDVVLMDVEMPGLDGRAAACVIQPDPASERIPVLFLTSHIPEDEPVMENMFGWRGVIAKPVPAKRLVARVAELLAENGSQGKARAKMKKPTS